MKVYFWKCIILFIAVIYIFVLFDMYFNAPNIKDYVKNNITWTPYEEFLENVDNGDLILLSGDTKGERTCRWASRCPFSHVGIILKENNNKGESKIYVWEADVGQMSKSGPRIILLEDKLKRYRGFNILGWTRLKGPRPSSKSILNLVSKYKDRKMDNWMIIWLLPNFSLFNNIKKDRKTIFCGELVSSTLQDLKILNKTRHSTNYSPKDFHIDKKNPALKELNHKFNYKKTLYIKFKKT